MLLSAYKLRGSELAFAGVLKAAAAEFRAVRKPPVPRSGVSDKHETAKDVAETAKDVAETAMGMLTLMGFAAFLVFLFIGYVATGGDSLSGFFWWVLDALLLF